MSSLIHLPYADDFLRQSEIRISDYFDLSRATRPGHVKSRVNVDIPRWMIQRLDLMAGRHGIPRQALIKHLARRTALNRI